MTPDEILKLARKAGIIIRNGRLDVKPNVDLLGSLEHFAKLVLWSDALFQSLIASERAAEREACAGVCEELGALEAIEGEDGSAAMVRAVDKQSMLCAAAIRARGDK